MCCRRGERRRWVRASKLPTHRRENTMRVLLHFADPLADGSAEVDVVEIIAREQTTDFSRRGPLRLSEDGAD